MNGETEALAEALEDGEPDTVVVWLRDFDSATVPDGDTDDV